MDVANDQLVGRMGEHVTVTLPKQVMTREEAIRHAAWLCLVADVTDEEWAATVAAIGST